ncbi:maltooligosyl trehalose synthase [Stutzerimonas stutzeri]|uniref:malto-oligosyltrehalose synthase n=1 Tax=Stutzerimonas stutzeri subgroup TaxID=578833 RepID=UPI000C6DA325|nr:MULTISPECIES: malto-oligosyltrehalose synthase [Stutzerimonas stutzeri subgroup]MCQ2046263.1 malto-oligosyltrehalose synthase [Stutzerimonas kunmingensis]PKR26957.1 malto-oligosyltrehalose synthase [Stutzerimonas stutzeri]QQC09760.1 malto-oligosyltrehalose synthase [Stutzerimonas stutzeri]VEI34538.1 maltooligosyl trehalose synthase [Stutzerimonas stutzeri]
MKDLTATLRLQFHRDFTLDDATALVDYFADLGISHIYASPLLTARPGSMHGYDVIDPTRINPELGGEPALQRLVEALRGKGMGLILDIVSNHMAVGGSGNAWWLDVLEWGRRSPYAQFFDIEWNSPDPLLEGQLLVPFLGSDYGEALQQGTVKLRLDVDNGSLYAEHYEHRFPITPPSYGEVLRAADHPQLRTLAQHFDALKTEPAPYQAARLLRTELAEQLQDASTRQALEQALNCYDSTTDDGFRRLHSLLERQNYRLASWRTAGDDINWRRFFDINELGGLRVERPVVFEETHAKIFELIGDGLVDGLRIDHIDGLADPRGYCRRLRRRVDRLNAGRPQDAVQDHVPIYVEKILAGGERLHDDWGVDGTTGYEFMNQVSLLQHDPAGESLLCSLWSETSGRTTDFMEEARQARQLVLTGPLAGDFETVALSLLQVARGDVMTRDITLGAIRRALLELIIHFPVYRTYIAAPGRREADEPFFQQALDGAKTTLSEADWPLLEHLQRWLGGESLRQLPRSLRKIRRYACTRFQQLTSPAAAKAVEDTACYRSGILLSRNDVGFDPQHFSAPLQAFHDECLQRAEHFPRNMLTTATHDHKRGEDTRARIAVISERAEWFAGKVRRWREMSASHIQQLGDGAAPSPGDELMLFQILLGSWPLELRADDQAAMEQYCTRILQWQEKALREAKLRTTWSDPNSDYESACRQHVEYLLLADEGAPFRDDIAAAAAELAPAGALNSLVQSLLRMTTPGVPDLYQGAEYWDFSLVDPDNRRPVDFTARQHSLASAASLDELLQSWHDGRIKQAVIRRTLQLRRRHPRLFSEGRYLPLAVSGEQAEQLLVFARELEGEWAVVVVPRLAADLLGDRGVPSIPAQRWGNTRIELPEALNGSEFERLFDGTTVSSQQASLEVARVLDGLSVAVLHTSMTANGESQQ